jgi:hypothetical protein
MCLVPAKVLSHNHDTTKIMEAKFALTAAKFHQRTKELKAARSRTVFLPDYKPETAVTVNKKAVVASKTNSDPVCKARTLEGRQCNFKAMAGGCFCKKHKSMV